MTRPKTMPTDAKPTLTPKLRFPEFQDGTAWKKTSLSSVLTEHGEQNDGASEVHSVSVHKGVVNQVEHLGRSFAATDRSNYNLAKPYDIVYTKSPTGDFPYGIVKQSKLPYNVIVSPLYGVFSPINRHLGYILDAYFESPIRTNNYLAPITQKGAKNTIQISNATFLSNGLYLPSKEAEHKKIAECLSTLDELIGAEGQKLGALKTRKKGLVQQLFPREGETQPSLRFPEFRSAGKWKPDTLENLCVSKISYGIVQAGPHVPNGMPYIKSTDLNSELCLDSLARTSDVIAKKYRRSEVRPGDLVFSLRGNIGAAQIVPPGIPVANLTQGTARLRTKGPSQFYLQALRSQPVYGRILAVSKGSTFQEISLEDLRQIRLLHPDEAEQQRIASCLSSLDELIAAQGDKLSALKTHKQGLMQQLFPSPAEADA